LFFEAPAISIRRAESQSLEKLNLEKLTLCGFVLGDNHLTHLAQLFPKVVRNNSYSPILELGVLVIEDDHHFPLLLESINAFPRELNVFLSVDIRRVSFKTFCNSLAISLHSMRNKNLIL